MTQDEIRQWLESEQTEFPQRASGEQFYEFMIRLVGRVATSDRAAVIRVMEGWLQERAISHTDLALEISKVYLFVELIPELTNLRSEVQKGVYSLPFYENRVTDVIDRLCLHRQNTLTEKTRGRG